MNNHLTGPVNFIRFRLGEQELCARGRVAWALSELLAAGAGGCTPITHPGPRWSDYVHKMRGMGLNIETITELHGGAFAGHHARYVNRSDIEVIDIKTARASNAVAA